MGQLLVWEWQSESYVFKQQGHFNNMASLAYSPDGQYIVTGGDDGKVSASHVPPFIYRSRKQYYIVVILISCFTSFPLKFQTSKKQEVALLFVSEIRLRFHFHRSKCGTPTAAFASSPSQSTPAASPTSPSPPAASSSSARLWTGRSERSTCTGTETSGRSRRRGRRSSPPWL